MIVALGLCGVTYPDILIIVAWKNFVDFKAVDFVTTILVRGPISFLFPIHFNIKVVLKLGHTFIFLCVLTKSATYLFSFKGISKAATHSQTPNSQRAVVSLRAVLYQEITTALGWLQ